jgi:tRNA U55 pseudouridine synthase TruB
VERACAAWAGADGAGAAAFSAKHVDGRRAYARASRRVVTLAAATVRIDAIEIERYDWPELEIVVAAAPTYLRGVGADLGEELGTGGHCDVLRRLASDRFASKTRSVACAGGPAAARALLARVARWADRPEVD